MKLKEIKTVTDAVEKMDELCECAAVGCEYGPGYSKEYVYAIWEAAKREAIEEVKRGEWYIRRVYSLLFFSIFYVKINIDLNLIRFHERNEKYGK